MALQRKGPLFDEFKIDVYVVIDSYLVHNILVRVLKPELKPTLKQNSQKIILNNL